MKLEVEVKKCSARNKEPTLCSTLNTKMRAVTMFQKHKECPWKKCHDVSVHIYTQCSHSLWKISQKIIC